MTPEEFYLLIPGYLSGQLSNFEKQAFEAQLAASAELREELAELRSTWDELGKLEAEQPSPALRARFYRKLDDISTGRTRISSGIFAWWKPGLSGLVRQTAVPLALFILGLYMGRVDGGGSRLATPPKEVAQLETQVQDLRRTVALSLLDRQSPSSRLEGVSWSTRVDRLDPELLSALLQALNRDGNTNVRLSSLDALEKFGADPAVRQALVKSLNTQDSPLVQIALIDALVHMRDQAAAGELRKLTKENGVNSAVQERARWGLQRLALN